MKSIVNLIHDLKDAFSFALKDAFKAFVLWPLYAITPVHWTPLYRHYAAFLPKDVRPLLARRIKERRRKFMFVDLYTKNLHASGIFAGEVEMRYQLAYIAEYGYSTYIEHHS